MSDTDRTFASFELDDRIAAAVADLGFEESTPIQAAAIPVLMQGADVIGRARTGSGKTAAFGLPLLERVKEGGRHVRAIVLTPTRELALQVTSALESYARHLPAVDILTVYGGASYTPQISALRRGVPVVVGTPGRVLDHIQRGTLDLSHCEMFVLDEGDEMLRMGFIDDVEAIMSATPETRQVALFSASMPKQIRKVAERHMRDPQVIQVESSALTVDHIEQFWMRVPQRHKLDALERLLAVYEGTKLVFARTRRGCADVADALAARGLAVDALHGDLNQPARERVLQRLRAKGLEIVIATDVAARGIDVDHITCVINLDLPEDTETYVHRIGRTGRAGRKGIAISLATPKQKRVIRELARTLKVPIEPLEVPSDSAIRGLRRRMLSTSVTEVAGDADQLADARNLLTQLVDSGPISIEDVAAAALAMLAEERDIMLAEPAEQGPPGWATRSTYEAPPDHQRFDNSDMVELFLPIGRRNNVRPGDLVGAIANEADIPGSAIGRIQIFDAKSFVGVPRQVALGILQQMSEIEVRGNKVPIKLSHAREGDSPPRGGARPPTPRKQKWNQRKQFGKKDRR